MQDISTSTIQFFLLVFTYIVHDGTFFLQILPKPDLYSVIVVKRALASIKSGKKRGQKLVGFFANFRSQTTRCCGF